MKKSVDILGLPVISISEGLELGTAKSLVINPAQGAVAALVIDDGKWYLGAKLLPFAAIAGLGDSAITVESASNVVPVSGAPDLEKLLAAGVTVIGAKVLTKTGRIQGKITEIAVDAAGKIVSCEIEEADGGIAHIPTQRVFTFAKDVVIVADGDAAVPAAKPAEAPPAAAPAAAAPAQAAADDDSAKKFDDKQRKYLLGKKANRRIETDNGVVIVEQGGEITEEVIQKAKLAGKFVELSMSI
ncbi:MAG: PRC-barrel domain-containing protein [Sporomusaceae bacterium]|nr:PRC-barrel domain-containing protein [Sporomusaceae bacterium]